MLSNGRLLWLLQPLIGVADIFSNGFHQLICIETHGAITNEHSTPANC
jgi:hypothetical protein